MITSVDKYAGIVLDRNPQWDPATDEVRTALPDQVVVRTGLSGLERDQALLAGSADIDISGTGVQTATIARLTDEEGEDDVLHGRLDDLTTGTVRLLAMPTAVAPMDNPACRLAVGRVVDRWAVQAALGGAVNAVRTSQLWPRDLHGAPEESDPAAGPRPRPRRAGGVRAARRVQHDDGRPGRPEQSRRRRGARRPAGGGRDRRRDQALPPGHLLRDRRRQAVERHRPAATASSWRPGRPTRRPRRPSWRRWSTAAASGTPSATPTTPC